MSWGVSLQGTGAEILVEALIRAGVGVVFGFPGDTGVGLYDALARRREEIAHVLAHDERAAATMADAFARVTNRVGVVEASSGGGVTFLVAGLGEPFAASVPMLVITSDIHRQSRGSSAITEIDQPKLLSAVTKAQFVVEAADDMARLVQGAVAAAASGRPGPVSLIVPEDVLEERARADFAPARRESPSRATAEASRVRLVARALAQARRPALLLGSGVHLGRAHNEVRAVAELLGAAVATTIHGKGSFDEGHPLSLGVVGANGARDYANRFLAEADVVLMVGTRANSTDTNGFTSPPRDGACIAHLDIDEDRAGRNYPGSTALVGDATTVLTDLARLISPVDRERRARVEREILAERARFNHQRELAPPTGLSPRDLVEVVQEAYGHRAVVVGDPGTPTPYLAAYWRSEGGRREVVLPRGHGPMGFAVPAAVGVALADPARPVVAFTTDGSLSMACGELETIQRLRLPVLVIHLANGSLGWIKALQHFYFDRRYFGVDLGRVDAVRIAEGFGMRAVRTATLDTFRTAVADAAAGAVPVFVDVAVPEEFEHLPPVALWLAALVGEGSRPVY
jgi:acetolactate synthase-1/2/3 large subunit